MPLKGYKQTKEHRKKLIGNQNALGTIHTKEFRQAISQRMQGNQNRLGATHTEEACKKMSKSRLALNLKGASHPRWKEDRSLVDARDTPEYYVWRKAVFERDNHTCQECNQVGGQLQAHHLKPVKEYPELIYDINNGQTLCLFHHAEKHPKRHSWIIAGVI